PVLCRGRALYSFKGDDITSLSFEAGNIIEVFSKAESGWWLGHKHRTSPGWFPRHYIEEIKDVTPNETTQPQSLNTNIIGWTVQLTEDGEGQYLFNPTTGEMR
ncbi:SH3 domain-containing protein, partial [Dichotomocladium elegans]